jgi:two-component system phosphate regulon response regulator PhoB
MWCDNSPINLSAYQFRLLEFLMTHPQTVFSRAEILKAVWPKETSEEAVSACIARLRRLLKPYGQDQLIRSVVGGGYSLDVSGPRRPDAAPRDPSARGSNGLTPHP